MQLDAALLTAAAAPLGPAPGPDPQDGGRRPSPWQGIAVPPAPGPYLLVLSCCGDGR
ncbi:hypothetical protein AB0O22_16990 [Streptomyces sp. NPDC091204]|uniref:hypothetical protein n=1 Tax=Streptomyces sp. NPDC091204 TaxID=3155299 RepID=UPI00343C4355